MISLEEYRASIGGYYSRALSLSKERGAKWKKRRKKNKQARKSEPETVENNLEDAENPTLTVRGILLFTLLVMFGKGIIASGSKDLQSPIKLWDPKGKSSNKSSSINLRTAFFDQFIFDQSESSVFRQIRMLIFLLIRKLHI